MAHKQLQKENARENHLATEKITSTMAQFHVCLYVLTLDDIEQEHADL